MRARNIFTSAATEQPAHGGVGTVRVSRPLVADDFVGTWHFVDYAVLPPGSSIGRHRHGADEELYLILEGEGLMTVDGEEHRVGKGDLILNRPGGEHGLVNDGDGDLAIFVVEVGLPG